MNSDSHVTAIGWHIESFGCHLATDRLRDFETIYDGHDVINGTLAGTIGDF